MLAIRPTWRLLKQEYQNELIFCGPLTDGIGMSTLSPPALQGADGQPRVLRLASASALRPCVCLSSLAASCSLLQQDSNLKCS